MIQKEFDSEPVHDNKFVKPMVRLFDVVYKNFHASDVPIEGIYCVCLLGITNDSIMKINRKYYPQVYLFNANVVEVNKMTNDKDDEELELNSCDKSDVK